MSTLVKTADLDPAVLTYKIVEDIRLAETAIVDVTQGAGTLRAVEVDATAVNADGYLKFKFTSTSVTVGTTTPDMVVLCPTSERFTLSIPGGVSFDGLSAWIVDGGADSSSANTEAAAGRYTIVRFITT